MQNVSYNVCMCIVYVRWATIRVNRLYVLPHAYTHMYRVVRYMLSECHGKFVPCYWPASIYHLKWHVFGSSQLIQLSVRTYLYTHINLHFIHIDIYSLYVFWIMQTNVSVRCCYLRVLQNVGLRILNFHEKRGSTRLAFAVLLPYDDWLGGYKSSLVDFDWKSEIENDFFFFVAGTNLILFELSQSTCAKILFYFIIVSSKIYLYV